MFTIDELSDYSLHLPESCKVGIIISIFDYAIYKVLA